MKSPHEMFHEWLKLFGCDLAPHESHVTRDIEQYAADKAAFEVKRYVEMQQNQARLDDVVRQNARTEALEEAAKVADLFAKDSFTSDTEVEAENIAKSIRALKEKP